MSRIAGVRRVAALAIILPGLGLAAEALAQTRAKPAAPAVRRPAAPAAPPVKARDWGVSDALLRTAFDEEIASAALKDATIPELQAAAQRGDPRAQTILGMIYEHGSGGQARDVDRAATLYEQAAAKVPRAKNNYAFMLQNGLGVVKDLSRALALYKESFAEGNANAAVDIGRMYAGGVGVAKDPAQAHLWFLRAAEGGVPAAMRLVGNDYRSGTGVAKDTATARTWYERAIVAGDRLSFAPMGDFYQFGDGVTVDLVKAAEFYRTGDEKGDLISTSRLGYFYVQGQGGLPRTRPRGSP